MYFCSFVNLALDPYFAASAGLVVVFFYDVSAEHQAEAMMSGVVRAFIFNEFIGAEELIDAFFWYATSSVFNGYLHKFFVLPIFFGTHLNVTFGCIT